jgi:uncharacterized protein (TIGR02265 family)
MPTSLFPADSSVALRGPFDLARAVERTRTDAKTAGIFFVRLRSDIGDAWKDVAPTLDMPPRLGRYMPFSGYPSRDHIRVIDAAARVRFPDLPTREAHRRLGVASLEDVAKSTFGRVTLELVPKDPASFLARFPEAYDRMVKGAHPLTSTPLDGGGVRLVFGNSLGVPEYMLGLLEAIVSTANAVPHIEVAVEGDSTRYDVRWTRG